MRVALCFANFGPYHLARLQACHRLDGLATVGVQLAKEQSEYLWSASAPCVESIVSDRPLESVAPSEWPQLVSRFFAQLEPDVCAIAGYSHPGMLAMLDWCNRNGRPAVLMSDSTRYDDVRRWWKESFKRRLLRRYSAAFVAGVRHREYLQSLGFRKPISVGYDVVDNAHFCPVSTPLPSVSLELPRRPFFLACARFIQKKNLPRLLEAYAAYRSAINEHTAVSREEDPNLSALPPSSSCYREVARAKLWDLVLLGEGPLRPALSAQIQALGLQDSVLMPGFKPYEELPTYYARASAFVHCSTSEQWGLVVNEAMASGLPVIVSHRCGCVPELVHEGENGFTFEPTDTVALSALMTRIAQMPESARRIMGQASQRIVQSWDLECFSLGLQAACRSAKQSGMAQLNWIDTLVLLAVTRR